MVGLVAQPESPLGEHGGGVRRATSSSPVLLPGTSRPLPPPRQPPCADGASIAPLCPPPPIAAEQRPRCLGSSQSKATQTLQAVAASGHASLAMEEPGPAAALPEGRGRDERSLEALSLAGGGGAAVAGRQLSEGRRATLASALELEGTVLREGRLTQFVANNLERRIRLSGAPRGEPPAGGGGSSIPAIDPGALQDVVALAGQVAAQVDELLRNVHCGLQALTALSVGCIQTYRDGVESLGEAADLSIRAMYALVARCEELDRAMQPVPALAKRIRDMKGTLERLEGLCK
ncbi:BLOC-1-related complex subunit 6 [Camarhynchus parvulus]|uniref:BLOC-1-related complex subunit 6 n=1 Tax=Geospiza parvula TaxID=87175 RepID=UPI0012381A40|nr:BLOC-1-related complex subunit 6 [Camarhynchus parvulus]